VTTIAWDGKTLAADKCSWSGGVRRTVRKVFKIVNKERGTLLVGFCGTASFCLQVLAWMEGKGERPNPAAWFTPQQMGDQCCLAIDQQGNVWCLANDLHWQPMEERIYAHGAGQEFAWGALEAGATAVRAIEIAMKRSDYAALGVDSVEFS
jgi:hypothetical protein